MFNQQMSIQEKQLLSFMRREAALVL